MNMKNVIAESLKMVTDKNKVQRVLMNFQFILSVKIRENLKAHQSHPIIDFFQR